MAKCERREIKPEPPPVEFVLTLTETQASVLAALTNATGSPTQEIAEIHYALVRAGVPTVFRGIGETRVVKA